MRGRLRQRNERGLRRLVAGAFLVLALGLAGVFVAIALGVDALRHEGDQRHTEAVALTVSGSLERSVVDLETGVRGYLLTDRPLFLEPYRQSLVSIPVQLASLRAQVKGDFAQSRRLDPYNRSELDVWPYRSADEASLRPWSLARLLDARREHRHGRLACVRRNRHHGELRRL